MRVFISHTTELDGPSAEPQPSQGCAEDRIWHYGGEVVERQLFVGAAGPPIEAIHDELATCDLYVGIIRAQVRLRCPG